MARRGPRDLLRRLGVDVVRHPLHGSLGGHLRWLFGQLGVTTVLDVGANEGQFAHRLRQEGRYPGRIVSFEPAPDTVRVLERTSSADAGWEVRACALGARDEQLDLLTFAGSDWNSFHRPDAEHLARAGRLLGEPGTVACPVRRLDGLWDDVVRPGEVPFLKSDTQGHDLQVLAGAGGRLDDVVGLLLEASIETFYEDEPDLREVLATAAGLGFRPSGFFPVTRRRSTLALDTVDVCFVRG